MSKQIKRFMATDSVGVSQIEVDAIGASEATTDITHSDGSVPFSGNQAMGSNKLTGLTDGSNPADAINKGQLDSVAAGGASWKEVLLAKEQVLDGASGGILQAMLAFIKTNPTSSDTFVLDDGTPETFGFGVGGDYTVTIGGSAAVTQTNLVASINANSAKWSAIEVTGLDKYFSESPSTQFVVYRTATSSADDRLHGTSTSADQIQVVEFATGDQNYEDISGVQSNLPAADPAAKRFGVGRVFASLVGGHTHKIANNNGTYTWDSDDQTWQRTDIGAFDSADLETGGVNEFNADKADIDFTPANYVPATTPAEADNVDNLTSHLYGLDQGIVLRQELHKIVSGETTAGKFTLAKTPIDPVHVQCNVIGGGPQMNANLRRDATYNSGDTIADGLADFEISGSDFIFNASGGATDTLTGDLTTGDIILVIYNARVG